MASPAPVAERATASEAAALRVSDSSAVDSLLIRKILLGLAVCGIFSGAFETWNTTVQLPATGIISGIGFGAGLCLLVVGLAARSQPAIARVEYGALVLAAVVLIGWTLSTVYFQPGYGTDEAALEQYAANLLVHGHNPYGVDLAPALEQFRVPIQYATYTMSGGMVSQLGYPSFPVLLVGLFLPITAGQQTVVVVNALALLIALGLMARLLPPALRSLAPLTVVGLPLLFGYAVSGVNAVVMMMLFLGVAHRWNCIGAGGRLSRADWTRAVCLGLAVATQQLAWFVTPFVLVGIYLSRRGELPGRSALRVVIRFAAIAAAVFTVVNAPFIVVNPTAWLGNVADPLTQHAIPYGQGLIGLTLFLHLGGGALGDYTIGAGLAYVALLVLFAMRFRTLGRACFVLPSVALFLPTRSLAEYFMTLVAVWILSIATADARTFATAGQLHLTLDRPFVSMSPLNKSISRRKPWVHHLTPIALFAPAVAMLGAALVTPQPLTLQIVGVRSTGQLQSIWQIRLHVVNRSAHSLTPHFASNYMGQLTTFYNVLSGPTTIPAHGTATYQLVAPNRGSMPGLTTPFLVQGVTAHPETISSSALYTPQPYSAVITPGYVNRVIPAGQSVTLRVNLRSPFGADVHQAGVRVALGQLIYGQTGLIPAEATINNGNQGQTPVFAVTDASGTATFRVRDTSPQGRPIYFQAYIRSGGSFPFGYSDIVPVFWSP